MNRYGLSLKFRWLLGEPINQSVKNYRSKDKGRVTILFLGAKWRAKKKGLPFSITKDFINNQLKLGICPICGVKYRGITRVINGVVFSDSPSLDQIKIGEGYTEKNTAMICWSCNRLKGGGSADQLRRIADWIDSKKSIP